MSLKIRDSNRKMSRIGNNRGRNINDKKESKQEDAYAYQQSAKSNF